MSLALLLLVALPKSIFSYGLKQNDDPCKNSAVIFSKIEIACPAESCNTTECADFMSSFDDDAYAKISAGLATCTDGNQVYGDGGEYEGQLRMLISGRADTCGVESGLSKTPCEESFSIMFLKMDKSCPSACDDGDECEGNNCCAPGQSSYSPESCGTTACADFMSSFDDAAYAKLSAGFATCTDGYAMYAMYGDGGEYEDQLKILLSGRANTCGVELGLSKTPCEESASIMFFKLDNECPSACDDGDECEGDNCCAPGQSSYSPESCGTTECADFMSSFDDDAYAKLSAGLATCKDGNQVYAGYAVYGDGGEYEDQLRMLLFGRANTCGVELGLSKTPCEESASMMFFKLDSACPSACDDGDECEGDNCCAPGQSSYSPESCGTTECADFMSSFDDDAYAKLSAGLATCTDGYAMYVMYGDGGEYEGELRMLLSGRANTCGVELGLSKTPCDQSVLIISKMDDACPSACDDEDECEGNSCCAPGQPSHSPEICGTTACADFMASFDDDAYAELSAGLATCTYGYEMYGDGGELEGYLRTMLIESAKACGVESGFSSGGPSFLPSSLSSLTLTLTLITTQP
jgi:hypothetical protein